MNRFLAAAVLALLGACSSPPGTPDGGNAGGGEGGGNATGGGNGGGGQLPPIMLLDAGEPPDGGWRFVVGKDGGVFVAGLLTLDVPAGALALPTTITISTGEETEVDGVPLTSAMYVFEPAGLKFDKSVEVSLEVGDPAVGQLYWSTEADPTKFESVGFVFGGVAEGVIDRFSRGYTSRGACIDPNGPGFNTCNCAASDSVGGTLEKHSGADLGCGTDFPSDPYQGKNGDACEGYANRTIDGTRCFCSTSGMAKPICAVEFQLSPLQVCPTADGLKSFEGMNGDACSGYIVATQGQTDINQPAVGTMDNCSTFAADTKRVKLAGTLEGCAPVGLPQGLSECAPGTPPRDRLSQACVDLLDKGNSSKACPSLMGKNEAAVFGTRMGSHIENNLFARPGSQLTQVQVPEATKKSCGKPGAQNGKPDLMTVTPMGANAVMVSVGDVKPMTKSGISKGRSDIYGCYQNQVQKMGAKCAMPAGLTTAEKKFCDDIGATGKQVMVNKDTGTGFSPGQFCGPGVKMTDPPQKYVAHECMPGVTAYRCVD